MQSAGPYSSLIKLMKDDHRLSFSHIAVIVTLLSIRELDASPSFRVNTRDVMRSAHILSKATLYKVYKELAAFGYIIYYPSNDIKTGSRISIPDHNRFY